MFCPQKSCFVLPNLKSLDVLKNLAASGVSGGSSASRLSSGNYFEGEKVTVVAEVLPNRIDRSQT